MSGQEFSYELKGNSAWIRFNVPSAMNAISPDMANQLVNLLKKSAAEARCTVISGTGRAFCAGANLTGGASKAMSGGEVDLGSELEKAFNPLIRAMRDHPHPIITSVNGAAAGIGSSIALMGDIIIAARSAYFLQAFINIGLVPDGGATLLLPQVVGRTRAMELALLGDRLPAEAALNWGMINRLVDDADLERATSEMADRLAAGPTRALGATRRLIWQGAASGFDAQLDQERSAQKEMGSTQDFIVGVQAFFSKSKADFTGL